MQHLKFSNMKTLQYFFLINKTLYHRNWNGVLARCLDEKCTKEVLNRIHDCCCDIPKPPLEQRIHQWTIIGQIWSKMSWLAEFVWTMQITAKNCKKNIMVTEINNWRQPHIDFITKGILPEDPITTKKLQKQTFKDVVY